jgi:hypothetical protein
MLNREPSEGKSGSLAIAVVVPPFSGVAGMEW